MSYWRGLVIASIGCISVLAVDSHTFAGEHQRTGKANEASVREAGKSYVEALQRGDSDKLIAHWTADGIYVDATGQSFNAHELIKQHFGQAAANEASNNATVDSTSTVRFVTADVAIERGVSRANSGGADSVGHYTAIWVKQNGRWLLDNLQESAAVSSEPENPLASLAWMIGDWAAANDNFTARCSGSWTENKKFIVRRFTIIKPGAETLHCTQRIGWDPAASTIRSWGFDSDGGIHEGRWRSEGDAWIVKSTGVLANGDRSNAVNFWIPEGPDRCVLKTSHMQVGDVALEDSVVEFERVVLSR